MSRLKTGHHEEWKVTVEFYYCCHNKRDSKKDAIKFFRDVLNSYKNPRWIKATKVQQWETPIKERT